MSYRVTRNWKEFSENTGIKVSTGVFYHMVKNGLVFFSKDNHGQSIIKCCNHIFNYKTLLKFISNHITYEDGSALTFRLHYYDKPRSAEDRKEVKQIDCKLFEHPYFDFNMWHEEKDYIDYEEPIFFEDVLHLVNGIEDLLKYELMAVIDMKDGFKPLSPLKRVYEILPTISKYLKKCNLKINDFPLPSLNADYCKVNEKYVEFNLYDIMYYRDIWSDNKEIVSTLEEYNLDFGCIPNIDVISSDETELNYKNADGTDMIKIDYVRKDFNKIGKRIWEYSLDHDCGQHNHYFLINHFCNNWKVTDFEKKRKSSYVNLKDFGKDRIDRLGFLCHIRDEQLNYGIRLVILIKDHKIVKIKSLISEVVDVCIRGNKDPLLSEDNDYVDFFNKVKNEGPVGMLKYCTKTTNVLLTGLNERYGIPVELQTEEEENAFKERIDWYRLPIAQPEESYEHEGLVPDDDFLW